MTEPTHPLGTTPMVRKLTRSREDRMLAGVCGGLGRYLGVDPTIVRIVAVAFILSGVGLLAYVIAWVLIPESPPDAPEPAAPEQDQRTTAVVIGAALIAIGSLLVVRQTLPWFEHGAFWPLLMLGAGIAVLITARR
ncbi:MAG TPA: PspC domain-containing protein [Microlunatus sp.]